MSDAGKAHNPLLELRKAGQSVWLDYIGRDVLKDGTFERLLREDGASGVTSNPSIFKKALEHWDEYAGDLATLARRTRDPLDVFYELALADVGAAADLLRPTFDETAGLDGYVSFQLEPRVAHDAAAQVRDARRVFERLARPNIMIKVYGTPSGADAVPELIAAGVNVNITLLFSVRMYERVAEAYIEGIERRHRDGRPLDAVASVASFFVSRVDTAVDKKLPEDSPLRGKAAVANSVEAYATFRRLFSGPRWETLAAAGARVQRPLWASTGTKDPAYSDVKYVEELVAPDTVNTMPQETLDAFRDHGRVRPNAVADSLGAAREDLAALAAAGIDLNEVTDQLIVDGIDRFSGDLNAVVEALERRLQQVA